MGVILVYRVVGVDQRHTAGFGDAPGRSKGAEFALGMDDVRTPGDQFPQQLVPFGGAQPGTGVDHSGVHRTQGIDAAADMAVQAAGQSQHPDLVALAGELAAQGQQRSDHPVDGGDVPVGREQDLHRCTLLAGVDLVLLLTKTHCPAGIWQSRQIFTIWQQNFVSSHRHSPLCHGRVEESTRQERTFYASYL